MHAGSRSDYSSTHAGADDVVKRTDEFAPYIAGLVRRERAAQAEVEE